ncbi:MAG TPA: C39 family peptidase [Thermoanaerobaculia bacterium]|nr:C39 family peptidase [Thermoanaerobaculia bacterium]
MKTNLSGMRKNKMLALIELRERIGPQIWLEGPKTVVLDISGVELFWRFPLLSGREKMRIGFADITARPELGTVLLSFSPDGVWDEKEVVAKASEAARKLRSGIDPATVTFVAYSYPRVAVRFPDPKGDLHVDAFSLASVATGGFGGHGAPLFSALWSPLAATPFTERYRNRYMQRLKDLSGIHAMQQARPGREPEPAAKTTYKTIPHFPYHKVITCVWCVPACIQMILSYYRYEYDQISLAETLGLGTAEDPRILPCSRREFKVVKSVGKMSNNALDVEMSACNYQFVFEFPPEIESSRPVVAFTGQHAVVVIGYSTTPVYGQDSIIGFHLFDPDPQGSKGYSQWITWVPDAFRLAFFTQLRQVGLSLNVGVT